MRIPLHQFIHLEHRQLRLSGLWFVAVLRLTALGHLFLQEKRLSCCLNQSKLKNDPSYQVALVAALEGVHLLVALALVKVVLLQTSHHLHHLRVAGQFYSY